MLKERIRINREYKAKKTIKKITKIRSTVVIELHCSETMAKYGYVMKLGTLVANLLVL